LIKKGTSKSEFLRICSAVLINTSKMKLKKKELPTFETAPFFLNRDSWIFSIFIEQSHKTNNHNPMSEKPKLSFIAISSRIVQWLLTFICLLLCIFYVVLSITQDEIMLAPVIIFFVLILLFVPLYTTLFKSLGKTYGEGVSKSAPYIKGGLFVLRLFAFLLLSLVLISGRNSLKSEFVTMLNLSASSSEMAELVALIEDDRRDEMGNAIYNLEELQKKIDYPLLIAKNFEESISQVYELRDEISPGMEIYALNERLGFDVFSTMDSLGKYLMDYENSEISKYLPAERLSNLFIEYGEFYLEYGESYMADMFFRSAAELDPGNAEILLTIADIQYEDYNLATAAELYEQYVSLMKNDDKANKIPGRITDFLEAEMYGTALQKNLFECWLHDYPASSYETIEYYDNYDIPYMFIGDRPYGPSWYNLQYALYGPDIYYSDDSTSYGMSGCAARILGREPVRDNVDALEEILTMELFLDLDLPFNSINPEAVKWIRKNLIPGTEMVLIDKQCQFIYDIVFKNICRQKALGYALLVNYYDTDTEASEYEYAMANEEYFYGPSYLYDRYYDDAEYSGKSDEVYRMIEEAGFWLRRKIDGSYDEVWNLFSQLMNQFDPEWFDYIWEGWEYFEDGYYEEEYYEEPMPEEGY